MFTNYKCADKYDDITFFNNRSIMFNLQEIPCQHTDLGIMGLNVLDLNDFDKNFYVNPIHYLLKKRFS